MNKPMSKLRSLTVRYTTVFGFLIASLTLTLNAHAKHHGTHAVKDAPNIIVILTDDLGYGDLGAYNKKSKIPTPELDRLAKQGMMFTDMHTPSAVCTPTRYSLLTGRYAWRTHLKSGVLWGYSPLMIRRDRETIPSMLKKQGYHTAGIGKWHLGLGNGEPDFFAPIKSDNLSDTLFGGIKPGPNEVGFDYFFGIPSSLDMKPYVYIENGKVLNPVDGTLTPASKHRRDNGGGYWRQGMIGEGFDFQEVLPVLTDRAVDYINGRSKNKEQPFFLYLALTSPHTPWLPSDKFQGKSGAGYYGDFVAETDYEVGKVLKALKDQKLDDNTLVIFTSDNGSHWLPDDIEHFKHAANGPFRGQKADIHEGGHRVPFIARWPKHIKKGSKTDVVATLADVMATAADLSGAKLASNAGPDGDSLAPIFAGKSSHIIDQRAVIHHALDGMFAIRRGEWKLVEGLGSGGFTMPRRVKAKKGQPNVQLYNLEKDPAESNNVAHKHPKLVQMLLAELDAIRNREGS